MNNSNKISENKNKKQKTNRIYLEKLLIIKLKNK